MELKFIGRGAAINPLEGNTSAYFISNDELFLIDCGESVYAPLVALGLLNKVKALNIFITHLHGDHAGGLGSLLFYTTYVIKLKVNIVALDNAYLPNLKALLKIFGVQEKQYNLLSVKDLENKYDVFKSVEYVKTFHVEDLDCYSLVFKTDKGIVFYSGDTAETRIIEKIMASKEVVDKMFVDVTSNENGMVHIYLGDLAKVIPEDLKRKVYCMHYNDLEIVSMIEKLGFNTIQKATC